MQSTQCISCKHFLAGSFCKAFLPKPIPEAVQHGWVIHDKSITGDNGLRYEKSENYQSVEDSSAKL